MTRKRFVKLMMAKGYSRNQANNIANGVKTLRRGGYSELYRANEAVVNIVKQVLPWLTETIRSLSKAVSDVAESAKQAGITLINAVTGKGNFKNSP